MMMRAILSAVAVLAVLSASAVVGQDNAASRHTFSSGYRFVEMTGEELFANVCQGCHMPDARGAVGAGAYPALAANPRLAAAVYPINVLVHGQRAMPAFGESLTDAQIASVINYVRSHFGNHYKDAVTVDAVKARR